MLKRNVFSADVFKHGRGKTLERERLRFIESVFIEVCADFFDKIRSVFGEANSEILRVAREFFCLDNIFSYFFVTVKKTEVAVGTVNVFN
jgi:hypothetical protein